MNFRYLRKGLLYVSLSPLLYLIIQAMIPAISGQDYGGFLDEKSYGVEIFLEAFVDQWFHVLFSLNHLTLWFGGSMLYLVYYGMTQVTGRSVKTSLYHRPWKEVLFYIAIGVWIFYFLGGLHAMFWGYTETWFMQSSTYTGLEGFLNAMLWRGITFTIIPVLPFSLAYIIVYLLKGKRLKAHKETSDLAIKVDMFRE